MGGEVRDWRGKKEFEEVEEEEEHLHMGGATLHCSVRQPKSRK